MSEDDEKDTASGSTAPTRRRISDADYASARDQYELGTKGLVELADAIPCTRQALSSRFRLDGVKQGSRAHELVEEQAAARKEAVKIAELRFADKRAEWIEETRMEGVKSLKQASLVARKLVVDQMKKIGSGLSPGASLGDIDGDLRAASRFNKILIENTMAALKILRADDFVVADDLPSLTIEDLTEEEVLNHHKMTGAIPESMTLEEFRLEEMEIEDID